MIFSRYKRLGDDPDAIPPPPFGMPEDQYSPMPDGSPDYGAPPSDQNLGTTGGTATGPAAQISQQPDPAPSMRADSMDAAKGIKPIAGPPQPPPGLNAPQLNTGGGAPDDPATFAPPLPPPGIQGAPLPPLSKAQQYQNQYDALKAPEKPKPGIWQKLAAAGLGATAGFSNVNPRNNHIDASGAEQALLLGPKYMRDQAQYEQSKGDLQNKIKLADDVENIASKSENRLASAANRKLSIENAATAKADALKQQQQGLNEKLLALSKDGINRVPANTPPLTPEEKAAGIEEREDVFGDPKYKTRVNTMNGMVRLPDDVASKFTLPKGLPVHVDKLLELAKTAYDADKKAEKEKTPARDDQAIAIYAKPPAARTPEENAYLKGYEKYVDATKVQPGVLRMEVLANNRPYQMVDPGNPESVVYGTGKQVMGQQAPSSIPFQTAKALEKDMTSGTDAKTLTNINTAHEHVSQMLPIIDALGSGDYRLINRATQAYAEQTGQTAPASFQLVKTALIGELGKTFTGGVATVEEGKELSKAINSANSPQQLKAVMQNARQLMESKRHQIQVQYENGKQGKPNFGQNNGGGRQGGGPPPAQQGGVIVQTPHGPMTFKDQATANAYKLAAGIK